MDQINKELIVAIVSAAGASLEVNNILIRLNSSFLRLLYLRQYALQTNLRGSYFFTTTVKNSLILLEETSDQELDERRMKRFVYRFRMKRESFFKVLEHFRRNAEENEYTRGWSLTIELLVFIRWITGGSTFVMTGDTFGMAYQTVSDIVHRLLPKVCKLAKNVIKLPEGEELAEIAEGFERLVGSSVFNGVVGAIDGSLIRFNPKKDIRSQYIDRKHGTSLNMTIVCDDKLRIRYLITGFPGSVHDSRVYLESSLFRKAWPPAPYMMIGDGAYCCLEKPIILMTPYRNPTGSDAERKKKFNKVLSTMRVKVENTIGLLKARMRCLISALRSKSTKMCIQTIVASAVLHNICLADLNELESFFEIESAHYGDMLDRTGLNDRPPTVSQAEDEEIIEETSNARCVSGSNFRDGLCEALETARVNPQVLLDHNYWFRNLL